MMAKLDTVKLKEIGQRLARPGVHLAINGPGPVKGAGAVAEEHPCSTGGDTEKVNRDVRTRPDPTHRDETHTASTRRTVYAALDDLEDSLAALDGCDPARSDRRTRLLGPPSDYRASYSTQAAAINALLSTVDDGPVDEDAAHGFMPAELGSSVEDSDLDLALLRPSTTLRGYQAFDTDRRYPPPSTSDVLAPSTPTRAQP